MADTTLSVFDSAGTAKSLSVRTNSDASLSSNVSTEGKVATYSLTLSALTALAATTTDFFALVGSATKKVKLRRVELHGVATGAAFDDYYLYKRTAANTGGTAASQAANAVKHVTADAAMTAVPNLYSANPTGLGTGTVLKSGKLYLPATGTPGVDGGGLVWDFSRANEEAPAIDGVAEAFCLNRAGAAVVAGTSLYITMTWTEE